MRADFAGPVSRALETRDPGTRRLFEALTAFIAAAPADLVAHSDAILERVLRPPLAHWHRVPRDARPAYWAMVRALPGGTVAPGPGMRSILERAALGIGQRHPAIAGALLAYGLTLAVSATRWLLARLPGRHRSATGTAARTDPDRR